MVVAVPQQVQTGPSRATHPALCRAPGVWSRWFSTSAAALPRSSAAPGTAPPSSSGERERERMSRLLCRAVWEFGALPGLSPCRSCPRWPWCGWWLLTGTWGGWGWWAGRASWVPPRVCLMGSSPTAARLNTEIYFLLKVHLLISSTESHSAPGLKDGGRKSWTQLELKVNRIESLYRTVH